jgi:uncharacterized membrane protein
MPNMLFKRKKIFLVASMLALIGLVIILFFTIFEKFEFDLTGEVKPVGFFPKYRPSIPIYMLPIPLTLLVVATISLSYYLISTRLEKRLEKKFDLILKVIKKNSNEIKNTSSERDVILKFLNPVERKVLESLIEKKNSILQSEICRKEGMNKLKVHRAVKELKRKGIIKTEKYGKTNKLILSEDVKEILLKQ